MFDSLIFYLRLFVKCLIYGFLTLLFLAIVANIVRLLINY